jgi:hypothetical protein
MIVRSFESLDFPLAWRRVLQWARSGSTDSVDRLPFEIQDRLEHDAPGITADHHVAAVTITMASKKSGTFRPFARFEPIDLMLYQALVDKLAPTIEATLGSREHVMAYRQTLEPADNPFAGGQSFLDYAGRVDAMIDAQSPQPRAFSPFGGTASQTHGYVLSTDLSGYFMHIDVDELERSLLAAGSTTDVVRDLADLLRHWQLSGIRGLPQGVRASSPLGNFYLAPLDALLTEMSVDWVRWMDDITLSVERYADARRILDAVEKLLYHRGLTLNSEKTSIRRADPAASPLAPDALVRRKEATLGEIAALIEAGYLDADEAPEPAAIDEELALEELNLLLDAATAPSLPQKYQSRLTSALRDLEALEVAHRVDEMSQVLTRAPDMTYVVLRYVAAVAAAAVEAAVNVFLDVLSGEHYLREYEKLAACKAALGMPASSALAEPFAALAISDSSHFVRARALLAWGPHSADDDFEVADAFWPTTSSTWKAYPLVAIQRKESAGRDARYGRWGGEGRYLGNLVAELRVSPIRWTKA